MDTLFTNYLGISSHSQGSLYFSPIQGRLPHSFGKDRQGYTCRSLFVDHASGKIFNFPQYSNNATEIIKSATRLEAIAQEEESRMNSYHSDNRIFAATEFKDHCNCHQMKYSFNGVGAKHQNGIAERNIKTVAQWAHANMFLLANSWPQCGSQHTGHRQLIMQRGFSTNSQTWNPEFLQVNYGLVYAAMTAYCNVPTSLAAQSMSSIQPFKMERKFQNGTLGHVLASSLDFQTYTLLKCP
jgi:hypothetical protein